MYTEASGKKESAGESFANTRRNAGKKRKDMKQICTMKKNAVMRGI